MWPFKNICSHKQEQLFSQFQFGNGALLVSASLQDVMVVGEPTLMGGEFGDEDERLITRLENTQYDATNGLDDEDDFNGSPALGNNAPWSSKPPTAQDSKPESTAPQPSQ